MKIHLMYTLQQVRMLEKKNNAVHTIIKIFHNLM